MHHRLLDLLACPGCGGDLALEPTHVDGEDVVDGRLRCRGCGREAPVTGGIPRFAGAAAAPYGNFETQWRRWGRVQIDRLSGHTLSEGRLLNETGWERDWFQGRLILDAGCGAGRFADVAAGLGAEVIAVDISGAVDACRDNLAARGARVHCVQASLFALPLKPAVADGAYCVGVIQHTPDPEGAVASVAAALKPGGRLAVNFYERDLWPKLQPLKYGLRLFTPRLAPETLHRLCRALVAVFFPLSRLLSRIRGLRLLNHVLPICAVHDPALSREQQVLWTLLDTFDWYGPVHEIRQRHGRIAQVLRDLGMRDVEARPGIARAVR